MKMNHVEEETKGRLPFFDFLKKNNYPSTARAVEEKKRLEDVFDKLKSEASAKDVFDKLKSEAGANGAAKIIIEFNNAYFAYYFLLTSSFLVNRELKNRLAKMVIKGGGYNTAFYLIALCAKMFSQEILDALAEVVINSSDELSPEYKHYIKNLPLQNLSEKMREKARETQDRI